MGPEVLGGIVDPVDDLLDLLFGDSSLSLDLIKFGGREAAIVPNQKHVVGIVGRDNLLDRDPGVGSASAAVSSLSLPFSEAEAEAFAESAGANPLPSK